MTSQALRLDLSDMELVDGFIEDCELMQLSSETVRTYNSCLKILVKFLNSRGKSITRLDRETLREILNYLVKDRRLSFKTLSNYFTSLSRLYDFFVFEEKVKNNPVLPFRKRYIRKYKALWNSSGSKRKLISVEEMSYLINSILNPRDKAIVTVLAKTGIRRQELINIDLDDIDWVDQSVRIKNHPKRMNGVVFFDDETARVLRRWLRARVNYSVKPENRALFVGDQGKRLKRNGVYLAVTNPAKRIGIHDSNSKRMEDHFSPHCCRHWFTTHLRRNGIRRELLKELRGDSRNEAVDIYDHIDRKELKRAYLAAIPLLGIG